MTRRNQLASSAKPQRMGHWLDDGLHPSWEINSAESAPPSTPALQPQLQSRSESSESSRRSLESPENMQARAHATPQSPKRPSKEHRKAAARFIAAALHSFDPRSWRLIQDTQRSTLASSNTAEEQQHPPHERLRDAHDPTEVARMMGA